MYQFVGSGSVEEQKAALILNLTSRGVSAEEAHEQAEEMAREIGGIEPKIVYLKNKELISRACGEYRYIPSGSWAVVAGKYLITARLKAEWCEEFLAGYQVAA